METVRDGDRKIICVLGMHRSGTSVTTKMLGLLGASLGPEHCLLPATVDNPKGYWEHSQLVAINEEILNRFGGSWDEPPAFPDGWETSTELGDVRGRARAILARDFGDLTFWSWKDPRACLTAPFWQHLLPAMDYVLCVRNPVEVMRSLEKRDGFPAEKSSRLWLQYTAHALRATAGRRRLFVFYEDLQQDWQGQFARLAAFLERQAAFVEAVKDEAGAFVEKQLWRHKASITSCVDEPAVVFPAKSLYVALRARHSAETADSLKEDLDAAIDLFGRNALERQHTDDRDRRLLTTLNDELTQAKHLSQAMATERRLAEEELRDALQRSEAERSRSEEELSLLSKLSEQFEELAATVRGANRPVLRDDLARGRFGFVGLGRFAHATGGAARMLGLWPMPRDVATYKCALKLLARPALLRDAYQIANTGTFDEVQYCSRYPDVTHSRMRPLMHFLLYGSREGRKSHLLLDQSSDPHARILPAVSGLIAPTRRPPGRAMTLARRAGDRSHTSAFRRNCRRFALYTSSEGNYFFGEIRDLLAAGLEELGFSVAIRDERDGFAKDVDWHVVVAPHEFFYLGRGGQLLEKDTPRRLILLNTEQPSTQWFSLALDCFARAWAVWDISLESARLIDARGYPCSYLALGYAPGFKAAREVAVLPENYGTSLLEPEIRRWSSPRWSLRDRPIDVLFIGHASARRERFFAQAASVLSRYRCYLHFSNVAAPVSPGRTTHMDTETVMGLAQRSKILVNIHHGEDRYFEWHRIVIEGIWQRTLVVSEPCGAAPPFQAGLDYFEAPLESLASAIDNFLSTPTGQERAERIAARGFHTLTEDCRLAGKLRELILALHDVPRFPDQFNQRTGGSESLESVRQDQSGVFAASPTPL